MSDEQGPLFLLDGMSLAFRAYFAMAQSGLTTEDGTATTALHGFVAMLHNIIRDHEPSALAVAFDLPGGTFRDDLVEDYKGGRDETPDDLLPQFDMIRSVVRALAIPLIEVAGFEADDVLATLATEARDRQCDVVVVTGDRDIFQLVEDPHVRVLYNRRGVSDYFLYDEAGIVERTGVVPSLYPLLASLRGDPSDNLPGVPGVGEKTAAKLLNQYGDLDGIYSHLDELTPKLRQNLAENEGIARSNAEVIPLVREVPLEVTVDDLTLGGWDRSEAEAVFATYELRTHWRRISALLDEGRLGLPAVALDAPTKAATTSKAKKKPTAPALTDDQVVAGAPHAGLVVTDVVVTLTVPGDLAAAIKAVESLASPISVAGLWDGEPGRGPLTYLVLVDPAALGVALSDALLKEPEVVACLNQALAGPFVGHHVKEVLRSLIPLGIDGTGLVMDTAVAAYLLDPSTGDYALSALTGIAAAVGAPSGQLALDAPAADALMAAVATDAALASQLVDPFRTQLEAEGMLELHDTVECPLVRVLTRMEVTGVAVDAVELRRITDELIGDTQRLEAVLWELAGHEFNVNSTKQLRTVLYEELGLTPGRKTKTGYSTDAATLESLRDVHPIVETLLTYRELEKLRSTYGESLLGEVADDGRIHASFRQTVARTGRLSSDRPNLHNIPVRTDAGKRFRRAFVPRPGSRFLVADYNQIELRVIAHLSSDPGLSEAFKSGTDIHQAVAAGVYGVALDEVTHTQRERAKMVSYGLAYGMEAYGLSRRLSISVEEANEIMSRYFGAFPEVRDYMDQTVAEARRLGYTRTALGRMRPLPELSDANFRVRQAAERQAMNAGIQGLAADLFKVALIRLDQALEEGGLESRLVLQVHDEVIVEATKSEEDEVRRLTEDAMSHAVELSVPLEVSIAWGSSWAEAKEGG